MLNVFCFFFYETYLSLTQTYTFFHCNFHHSLLCRNEFCCCYSNTQLKQRFPNIKDKRSLQVRSLALCSMALHSRHELNMIFPFLLILIVVSDELNNLRLLI